MASVASKRRQTRESPFKSSVVSSKMMFTDGFRDDVSDTSSTSTFRIVSRTTPVRMANRISKRASLSSIRETPPQSIVAVEPVPTVLVRDVVEPCPLLDGVKQYQQVDIDRFGWSRQ
jgi:hypothetical protein